MTNPQHEQFTESEWELILQSKKSSEGCLYEGEPLICYDVAYEIGEGGAVKTGDKKLRLETAISQLQEQIDVFSGLGSIDTSELESILEKLIHFSKVSIS